MTAADVESGLTPDRRVDAFLAAMKLDELAPDVVALTGDASDRRYFRVHLPEDRSVVLAVHASAIEFAALPFANVAGLLRRMGMPIPEILGHSDTLGIVALEDLGDVTLHAHLHGGDVAAHVALYRQAVDLIVRMQTEGARFASPEYLPYTLAFDVEKLTWELRFFVDNFLEAHRGARLGAAERAAFDAEWLAIANDLAGERRVLCHRDYHSRNLMLHRTGLYLLDFQDARLGPDTYDLVSLLRDSYVDIVDDELEELVRYFLSRSPLAESAAEFRRRFDLMAVQRNLKALGTFGFQAAGRGNRSYLQYVPRTLGYVRGNLERYERFGRLRALLAEHIEELR